jgi:hypothetical protein
MSIVLCDSDLDGSSALKSSIKIKYLELYQYLNAEKAEHDSRKMQDSSL